ncbi:PadR family transcriptional regulator [Salinicola peritrichatus]|uniref:PadR family transcriptional regulator n=1 Tax=Salinicola peritrichatus TaxID=1267424 RepID=UPI0013A66CE1|nr:helix-turn-helix transcriptional regulator [Salinicola peritrichatus]
MTATLDGPQSQRVLESEHQKGKERRPPGLPLGMPTARKLNARELALLLLILIGESPAHGSALSERIEELSQGFYRPSPGSLYPALSKLLERGLIERSRQGRLKIYRLTKDGHRQCDELRREADKVRKRLQRAGHKLTAMRRAYELNMPDEDSSMLAQAMLEARMDLKAALHESLALPPDKQRMILKTLEETTTAIRALGSPKRNDNDTPGTRRT